MSKAAHSFWLDGGYDRDSVEACPHHPVHSWVTLRLGDVLENPRDPDEHMVISNAKPPGRRTKVERARLTEQARKMRAEGHAYEVIGPALGISPFTAAIYAPGGAVTQSLGGAPAARKRKRVRMAGEIRAARERVEQKERDRNRREAQAELERCDRSGLKPSWYPASVRQQSIDTSPASQTVIDELITEQKADDRWACSPFKRRTGWMASLDAPLTSDGYTKLDVLAAETGAVECEDDALAALMGERP